MTTALITGITGMVGSHLADYLIEHTDWEIVGLARWRSPLDNIEHHLDRINRGGRIRLVYGDLRDYVSIQRAVESAKPGYVFHLAAQSYPQTSFTAPLDTLETNVQGTAHVLEALRHDPDVNPVTHVCASSEVFGRVPERMAVLQRSLMLCYIPKTRKSGDVSLAADYESAMSDHLLEFLHESVNTALGIIRFAISGN